MAAKVKEKQEQAPIVHVNPFDNGISDDRDTVLSQIRIVHTHSKEGRHMIAVAAASAILFAIRYMDNGGADAANALVQAIGPGARQDSLVRWFENFGPLRVSKEKKEFVFGKRDIAKYLNMTATPELKREFGTKLVQHPFWVWEAPKNPFKAASLLKLIELAINKVESQLEDDDLDDEQRAKVDAVGLQDAKVLLSRIKLTKIQADIDAAKGNAGPSIN